MPLLDIVLSPIAYKCAYGIYPNEEVSLVLPEAYNVVDKRGALAFDPKLTPERGKLWFDEVDNALQNWVTTSPELRTRDVIASFQSFSPNYIAKMSCLRF